MITSGSAEESDSGAHDVVVGISKRLQVNSDVSDDLAVCLVRDDVVRTFLIRGPGTIECTRGAFLEGGEERVDEGKLAVTDPGVPPIYAPITLQSSSPIRTPALASASI